MANPVPNDSNDETVHLLRIGGVMRCCIATLHRRALESPTADEGERLPCDYCTSGLIYREGAWEWDKT